MDMCFRFNVYHARYVTCTGTIANQADLIIGSQANFWTGATAFKRLPSPEVRYVLWAILGATRWSAGPPSGPA
jgi:hypothetical protein